MKYPIIALIALASPLFAGMMTAQDFFSYEDFSEIGAAPSKPAADNTVGPALLKAKYLQGKPKQTAKYYIFLYSASWCGPCRQEMPKISELYTKEISKSPDVELVHFSYDQKPDSAKAWAKQEKVKFPVVMPGDHTAVPGRKNPQGIPFMQIVKADGTEITSGHGSQVLRYKEYIKGKN